MSLPSLPCGHAHCMRIARLAAASAAEELALCLPWLLPDLLRLLLLLQALLQAKCSCCTTYPQCLLQHLCFRQYLLAFGSSRFLTLCYGRVRQLAFYQPGNQGGFLWNRIPTKNGTWCTFAFLVPSLPGHVDGFVAFYLLQMFAGSFRFAERLLAVPAQIFGAPWTYADDFSKICRTMVGSSLGDLVLLGFHVFLAFLKVFGLFFAWITYLTLNFYQEPSS